MAHKLRILSIDRFIAHQVVRASRIESRTDLVQSPDLYVIDKDVRNLFDGRMRDAVGSEKHCVEVGLQDKNTGAAIHRILRMFSSEPKEWVQESIEMSEDLSQSQVAGAIQDGVMLAVQGKARLGTQESHFFTVVKADHDTGLSADVSGGQLKFKLIKDLILSKSDRLLKAAFITAEASLPLDKITEEDLDILVFDHHMSADGVGAAAYFYRDFLGCQLADGSAVMTKKFFETASRFIDKMGLGSEERFALRGDLISYMRSNEKNIGPAGFAKSYIKSAAQRDEFETYCKDKKVSGTFSKNTELIDGKLRRRNLVFSSGIKVSGPAEGFSKNVKILEKGPIDGSGNEIWTTIQVKGEVNTQSK